MGVLSPSSWVVMGLESVELRRRTGVSPAFARSLIR